ncbi:MAG: ribulose bisphosphate carboxylase small subunit [Actinomycetota bacterium]
MTRPISTRRLETFSYLPPLSDDELELQVGSILERRLVPAIEFAVDPGPRTVYWSMWKLPMFDATTAGEVLAEVDACAHAHPEAFVKLAGYDAKRQGQVASFVVRRPA